MKSGLDLSQVIYSYHNLNATAVFPDSQSFHTGREDNLNIQTPPTLSSPPNVSTPDHSAAVPFPTE